MSVTELQNFTIYNILLLFFGYASLANEIFSQYDFMILVLMVVVVVGGDGNIKHMLLIFMVYCSHSGDATHNSFHERWT